MEFILHPGQLQFSDLYQLLDENTKLVLTEDCKNSLLKSEDFIQTLLKENKIIYGINTGFGALSHTRIHTTDLTKLQQHLVLSHAAGTGENLSNDIVRLILALKINALARGYSGIKLKTLDALLHLYNSALYPCIPAKGSVGASGDLAPLAHLSAVLLGEGEASYQGARFSAKEALKKIHLSPLTLGPKEGLALLNGTQVSTALAIIGWMTTADLFNTAIITGALSVEAARGSYTPFDERIHVIRGHATQIQSAALFRSLLTESEIHDSHRQCSKVQDPYSLRCQPQVMGACLSHLLFTKETLLTEANGVSDNPLIFTAQDEILSGGNFHAEPVAFAADSLAIAIAEIGALSERRIALLIDPHFSGLPAFLVNEPGIHSGFMSAQVTAAALASENKSLAHPASVDSIPTSANQEDHVSMATYAARRLFSLIENTTTIIAIELLAACQGIDLLRPLTSSVSLEKVHAHVRQSIPFYEKDRYFAPDIEKAKQIVQSGELNQLIAMPLL